MAATVHTAGEAAEILRCTQSWLEDKARLREIPFTKLSGSYRFTDDHLEQIIRQFEVQPEQATAAAPRRRAVTTAATDDGIPQLRVRPSKRLSAAS